MNSSKSMFALMIAIAALFCAQNSSAQKAASSKKAKTTATAQPSPAPVLLPSQGEIDLALKRTFGYSPGLTWTIYDIKPAVIPGLADVLISMNKQPPIHVYVSPDTPYAIVGDLIPFGPDPFAPAREKLKSADGPTKGAASPVIDIVEFSDLECPHCKKAAPILDKLVMDFPQVRLRFEQFPLPASLHPWALKAAEYADCAGQESKDGFWKYVDAIFENQGSIAAATVDDNLKQYATGAGLDAAKVSACAANPDTETQVKKSMQLGQSLDVNQTPTVFINGRRVLGIGDIPYDQLKLLVQFEIDHAGK